MKFTSVQATATGFLVALLVASPAASRVTAASGGTAYYPKDNKCFERTYGSIRTIYDFNDSECQSQKYWTIDAQVRSFGSKTFSVYGFSQSSNTGSPLVTMCSAIVLHHSGTLASWTGYHALPTGSANWRTLGTLSVSTDQSVQYECFIAPLVSAGFKGFVGTVRASQSF